jgi:23S rRNA (adenine2503-C2)-methyltransferase
MTAIDKWRAISGIPVEELAKEIDPLPRFRATQIVKWIARGVASFDEMDNLPQELRTALAEQYVPRPRTMVEEHCGNDGTVKLALEFGDGARIESVLLRDKAQRYTACLSTQAGCPAGCLFCKTGTSFMRNLDSAEIVEQFLLLRARYSVSNIVIMGMGEPLLNLAELRRALGIITCKEGLNVSRQRITVSTCGIVEGITELAKNGPGVRLALSLTTADEALRRKLMPITANQNLAAVKKALVFFQSRGGGRITLEAVLLGGINTRCEDAASIAVFARGLDVVINLIPWNPVDGLEFEGAPLREPSPAEITAFTQNLESLGLNVTRRYRRGRGVTGACGQLSSH